MDVETRKLIDLFFHYDRKRTKRLQRSKRQLAHYTTADTAMKIISGKSLWLRNAGVMNDYREIGHGADVLEPIIKSELGVRLFNVLDAVKENMSANVMRRHVAHRKHARETVFMASLSEHERDNNLGRLSMWRAYGGPVAGVALLFRNDVTEIEPDVELQLVAVPVFYGGPNEFVVEFNEMLLQLERNMGFLKSLDPDWVENTATNLLQLAMYSIKHKGFEEEQEWRIIHRPYEFASAHIMPTTVTLSGIPQAVYKLPFHNPDADPLFNIPQLDLNDILEGVVIGPCLYPETVYRAFVDEMAAAGIQNPRDRVFVSEIPLRQQG